MLKSGRCMTLGELISALRRKDQDKSIYFDFCKLRPRGIDSYRGDYSRLAIGYEEHGRTSDYDPKVSDVLRLCEQSLYKTFTGWKGGEYESSEHTLMWAANPGQTGDTGIVDVNDYGWCVILETATCN